MDTDLRHLDWSLIEAFLAVAETGSLSAGARRLGISQPTMGRHIATLQKRLGIELFRRIPRGLELTDTGANMIAPAHEMRDAAQRIALAAAGRNTDLAGTVRITASEVMATAHLPPIVAALRRDHPEIEIELVPSDDTRNLLYREADIALRMYRPTQLDLVAKHLGDLPLGVFAARTYIDRRGHPTVETFRDHDFVGYDADPQIIAGFAQAGITVTRDFFALRCDDYRTYWELVRAGCGIGFAQKALVEHDPGIVEIDIGMPIPPLPVWLTAPEVMRRTPRMRLVWDALERGLAPILA